MGILKTTIALQSNDIFPYSVAFGKASYNQIQGDYSTFGKVETNSFTAVVLNAASLASGVAYIYLEAPSTNATPIYVRDSISGTVFCVLYPGSIGMLPYAQTAISANDIEAISAGPGANELNYFIGADVNTTTYNISINSYMAAGYVAGYVG